DQLLQIDGERPVGAVADLALRRQAPVRRAEQLGGARRQETGEIRRHREAQTATASGAVAAGVGEGSAGGAGPSSGSPGRGPSPAEATATRTPIASTREACGQVPIGRSPAATAAATATIWSSLTSGVSAFRVNCSGASAVGRSTTSIRRPSAAW